MICGCCGNSMEDTPEENMDYESRGQDVGYGICTKCAQWQVDKMFDRYKKQFRASLNADNRTLFDALPRDKQQDLFFAAIEEGVIKVG